MSKLLECSDEHCQWVWEAEGGTCGVPGCGCAVCPICGEPAKEV